MALQKDQLLTLARVAANAKASSPVAYSFGEEQFSTADVTETLRNELQELTYENGKFSYRKYENNKNVIFELLEKTIDDILPVKVREQYAMFAETMQVAQGDKYVFTQRISEASKARAKQFVTRVGLAGVYEVFKLDGTQLEIKTNAIGGACYIPFEEFLDGRVSWADVYDILLEGLDDYIYREIETAVISLYGSTAIPAKNQESFAGFNEAKMDKLLQIADAYAANGKSTIYCTFEFAAQMLPANTSGTAWFHDYSEDMKNELWKNGYFANYKGHNVVILRQSLEPNGLNDTKVLDPRFAFILPSTAEKPVKIVFEGDTCVREKTDNGDWSRELHTYKKVGVGLITVNPGICIYRNENLSKNV